MLICSKLLKIVLIPLTVVLSANLYAEEKPLEKIQELAYGRALYYDFQQLPLQAITQILVGLKTQSLDEQKEQAELLLGSLYHHYGLTTEAESIFNLLLTQKDAVELKNFIWFNIARLQYDRDDLGSALINLQKIDGFLPAEHNAETWHLLSNIHLKQNNLLQAQQYLSKINDSPAWRAYTLYNVGVALASAYQLEQGALLLAELGKIESNDPELIALRDKANLALGFSLLKSNLSAKENQQAVEAFARVRLHGASSSKALLGSGWGWNKLGDEDRSLTAWQEIIDQASNDRAYFEALQAIPYTFEIKGQKKLAASYYQKALENYDNQLNQRQQLLATIKQDALQVALDQNLNLGQLWPVLHHGLASVAFQRSLADYHDLQRMQDLLNQWENDLPAMILMLDERQRSYISKLPQLDNDANSNKLAELQAKRADLVQLMDSPSAFDQLRVLANEIESDQLNNIASMQQRVDRINSRQDTSKLQRRITFLQNLLSWQIESNQVQRQWLLDKNLKQLDDSLEQGFLAIESLEMLSHRASENFADLDFRIKGQQDKLSALSKRAAKLFAQQQQALKQILIDEIGQQVDHLKQAKLNTRFSLARLYDLISQEQGQQ